MNKKKHHEGGDSENETEEDVTIFFIIKPFRKVKMIILISFPIKLIKRTKKDQDHQSVQKHLEHITKKEVSSLQLYQNPRMLKQGYQKD